MILLVFKANVNEICITYGKWQSRWGYILISIVCSWKANLTPPHRLPGCHATCGQREEKVEEKTDEHSQTNSWVGERREGSPDQFVLSHRSSSFSSLMKHCSLCTFQTLGLSFNAGDYQKRRVMTFVGLSLAYYYQFSRAGLTKRHKVCGLNQHKWKLQWTLSCLSLALVAIGNPGHTLTCRHTIPISVSVFSWSCMSTPKFLFLIGVPVILDLGPTLIW